MLAFIGAEELLHSLGPELLEGLRAPKTLHHLAQSGANVVDVVSMDEFTNDVIVQVGEAAWAVYDST